MAIDKGMNIAEVRALGTTLQTTADKIDGQLRVLDQLVKRAAWSGPIATSFKIQWWPGHRAAMARMAAELREFSRSAQVNADEQNTASATAGVAGAGGSWAEGHAGIVGAIDGTLFAGELYGFAGDFKNLAKIKGLQGLFRPAEKLALPLAILGTGWDAFKLFDAVSAGNLDSGIRSGIDVGLDIGSFVVPEVGLAVAAWDVGWEVGKGLDWIFGEQLGGHQAFIDSVIDDQYGGSLSLSEADDLAHRYDGWSGFGNYAFDGANATVDAAESLFKKVFG